MIGGHGEAMIGGHGGLSVTAQTLIAAHNLRCLSMTARRENQNQLDLVVPAGAFLVFDFWAFEAPITVQDSNVAIDTFGVDANGIFSFAPTRASLWQAGQFKLKMDCLVLQPNDIWTFRADVGVRLGEVGEVVVRTIDDVFDTAQQAPQLRIRQPVCAYGADNPLWESLSSEGFQMRFKVAQDSGAARTLRFRTHDEAEFCVKPFGGSQIYVPPEP